MRQSDLEHEMRDLGVERYRGKVERSKIKEMETNHLVGRRLLTESVSKLADGIRRWKRNTKSTPAGSRHTALPYIESLAADLIAAITAKTVIDSISMHKKLTKTASTVGRMLENEARWREFKNQSPEIWRNYYEKIQKIPGYETKRRFLNSGERYAKLEFDPWPVAAKLKVGLVLIELLRKHTGIIDITTRTGLLGKRATYVHPTEELLEWIKEAHNHAEDLSPMYLPMVEKPVDWKGVYEGGYLTEAVYPRPLVKTQDRNHLDDLNSIDISEVTESVNHLQRVPWAINKDVYDVLARCWEEDIAVGDLPSAAGEPIPTKPIDIGTNEEARRKWRKAAARVRFENESENSKRFQVAKVLWMAKKFLGKILWFPWYMDFRSRMYPRPYFLQPQGPDWSTALLTSGVGKGVETDDAENWLAIHGANTWGMDKFAFSDRVEWTHQNEDMIRSVAADPMGSTSVWGKADSPFAFLAFCCEWGKYLEVGRSFQSTLPVRIDGASNGLQLFSLLMRDPVGAAATNVLPCDKPHDIYGDVSNRTVRLLEEDGGTMSQVWVNFGIPREATKRPTMVVPYSGTLFACRDYTISWFRDELKKRGIDNPFGWEELYAPCSYLAGKIWEGIGEVVGEARRAMSWFQQVSDICIDNGVPIRWSTPDGFLVKQAYETWDRRSVRTIIGEVIRQHRIRVGTGKLCRRKARNGISPNFIHSIDAAVARRAINKFKARGGGFINSVHDAIWVLPSDMTLLRQCLMEAVVEIFSEDLMGKFAKDVGHFLPTDVMLPPPPAGGDLDIESVRESEYFFS